MTRALVALRPLLRWRLAAALLGLSLVAAVPASAQNATFIYRDATGDAQGGALDLESLTVTNDRAGTLSLRWSVVGRAITADDVLIAYFDSDMNAATGAAPNELGIDKILLSSTSGQALLRWNGSGFDPANAPTLRATEAALVSINRSDLELREQMRVGGATALISNADAYDETAFGTFLLIVAPEIASAALTLTPRAPRAGQVVSAKATVRLSDGATVAPATLTCTARLGGRTLSPIRPCAWRLPRNARGKRLVVAARGEHGGTAFTARPVGVRVR